MLLTNKKVKKIGGITMLADLTNELLKQATEEEKKLYLKVFEATEEDVKKGLGYDKETVIKSFIETWINRIK